LAGHTYPHVDTDYIEGVPVKFAVPGRQIHVGILWQFASVEFAQLQRKLRHVHVQRTPSWMVISPAASASRLSLVCSSRSSSS